MTLDDQLSFAANIAVTTRSCRSPPLRSQVLVKALVISLLAGVPRPLHWLRWLVKSYFKSLGHTWLRLILHLWHGHAIHPCLSTTLSFSQSIISNTSCEEISHCSRKSPLMSGQHKLHSSSVADWKLCTFIVSARMQSCESCLLGTQTLNSKSYPSTFGTYNSSNLACVGAVIMMNEIAYRLESSHEQLKLAQKTRQCHRKPSYPW